MTAAPEIIRIAGPRVNTPTRRRRPVSHTLPPELLADAARRLSWAGLIYAGAAMVGHFGRRLLLVATGSLTVAFRPSDVLGVAMIALGVAMYFLSRSRLVSNKRLLDIGLVFEVIGALLVAAIPTVDRLPQISSSLFAYLPAECVWIAVFPLVVPNTPARVLIASLLAASMGPLVGTIGAAVGYTHIQHPLEFAANYLTSNYLCAAVAYLIARIVNGFGMQLKELREIGSYELLERIGEGGMGEVWRARHRLLARPAAIKLIRTDVLGNGRTRDAFIRRFEREARETAQLGSTHTVDVFDFGVSESGDFYYVMELLQGISLERYVAQFGPMEPPRVIYLLRQMLHSLGEAHRRGLIHRDVKPANVFLCRLGPDDDFVKVLDFGLVKHVDVPGATMLTKEGATAGTPAYMAPEIALGRPDVDGRADLYAVGCVAYHLLTGQPVFTGDNDVAVALAHVKDIPIPPSVRSEFDIPAALETLILDCLAKDPAARPATAADIDRRIAQIDLLDAWTGEKAHGWWELHQGVCPVSPRDPQARGDSSDPSVAVQRCWPRIDGRDVSTASV